MAVGLAPTIDYYTHVRLRSQHLFYIFLRFFEIPYLALYNRKKTAPGVSFYIIVLSLHPNIQASSSATHPLDLTKNTFVMGSNNLVITDTTAAPVSSQ